MVLDVVFPLGVTAALQRSTFAHCCEQINYGSGRSARKVWGKHAISHKSAVPRDVRTMCGVDVPGRARVGMLMGSTGPRAPQGMITAPSLTELKEYLDTALTHGV